MISYVMTIKPLSKKAKKVVTEHGREWFVDSKNEYISVKTLDKRNVRYILPLSADEYNVVRMN